MRSILSIDVESLGLYGDPFEVSYVLIDESGQRTREMTYSYKVDFDSVPLEETREFLKKNVRQREPNCISLHDLLEKFWADYISIISVHSHEDLDIVADCGCPVESNLFRLAVLQDLKNRQFLAPYPLHELGTLLRVKGFDPVSSYSRLPDELPEHDSLNDARQSGRIYRELLLGTFNGLEN